MIAHGYCQIAIDTPLRHTFDYRLPETFFHVRAGMRVRLPFAHREVVGLILRVSTETDVPAEKLREVTALLDEAPLFSPADLQLLEWAAGYYHHPIGEVVATALPKQLRTIRKRKPKAVTSEQAANGPRSIAA